MVLQYKKGVTLVELMITIALLSTFMPYALNFMRSFPKDIAISQTYVDTQENISDFVQNFQNLIVMSWNGEFRDDNGLSAGNLPDGTLEAAPTTHIVNNYDSGESLSVFGGVVLYDDIDAIYLQQLSDTSYDSIGAGADKDLTGWCRLSLEPMPAPNPDGLLQMRWLQCPDADVNTNSGEIRNGQLVYNADRSHIIFRYIKRLDINGSGSGVNDDPVFKLINQDPQSAGSKAVGVFVQCLVGIKSFDDSNSMEFVKLEFATYLKNAAE